MVKIDARATAKAVCAGRIALGAGYALAPGLSLRAWPGRGVHRDPAARFLARSTGVRDLALGLGTLLALQKDAPVRGWLEAGVLADAGDAAAILIGFRSLPRAKAVFTLALAVGTAVTGRRLVADLG